MSDSEEEGQRTDRDEQEEEYEDDEDEEENDDIYRLPDKAMSYEGMTISLLRMKRTMETQRTDLALEKEQERLADKATHKLTAADNLKAILKRKHRSYTGGWRQAIDINSFHQVGPNQFFTAMRQLGLPDDSKACWAELGGSRGHVTLAAIDSTSARILSDFYRAYLEKISRHIVDIVKDSDSLRVDADGFLKRCESLDKVRSGNGFLDLNAVFKALQLDSPYVTAADLEWLEQYCERGHKYVPTKTEEQKALEEEKAASREQAAQKTALDELRLLLQHKYGGAIAGWRRVIDPDGRGKLPMEDLRKGCNKVGFKGNFGDLWHALAGPKGFSATLEMLEPNGDKLLENFKLKCIQRFGSLTTAFEELMAKKKPLVTKDEFRAWCKEIQLDGSDYILWRWLDEENKGQILMGAIDRQAMEKVLDKDLIDKHTDAFNEMSALPKSPVHKTLVQRAKDKMAETKRPVEELRHHAELLKVFETKYGSSVRAWWRGLDPYGKGKLTRDEFFVGCAVLGFTGNLDTIWKELGLKENSNIRLATLDPQCGEEIRSFREKCTDHYGSVHDALGKVSKSKSKTNPKVGIEEFKSLCNKIGMDSVSDKLFAHLDAANKKTITASNLKWLKDIPDTDEKALARHLTKQVESQKKKHAAKIIADAAPAAAVVQNEQAQKSQATKQSRAAKQELADMRDKLLKMLATDYHGIARGWKIVMDPEQLGELPMDDFLTGLERLGMLKHDATDEELAKAEKLFHMLDKDDTKYITLANLDRGQTDFAMMSLMHHLDLRYGSVQRAFEIFGNFQESDGDMSVAAFKKMCQEAKFTSAIHRLVLYLDPNKTGTIELSLVDPDSQEAARDAVLNEQEMKEDNREVMKKKRPNYCRKAPDVGVLCGVEARDRHRNVRAGQKVLKDFKKALTGKFGSLQNAWFRFLSPDGEDTIDDKIFGDACSALGVEGEADDGWAALNLRGGELSLREFDPSINQDIEEFHFRMKERYGSLEKAIDETDFDDTYEVDYPTFSKLLFECQYRRNERRLFEYYGGEYAVKGSKIDLGRIDEQALENCKTKRAEDAEAKQKFEEGKRAREEIRERRRKGLPDQPTAQERAKANEEKARQEAKEAKMRGEEEPKDRSPSGMSDMDGSEVKSMKSTSTELVKAPVARAGADPVVLFRAMIERKFGTPTRAWRVLDCQKQAALTQAEFSSSLRVAGYGGCSSVLWNALGCKKYCSLKDMAPDAFQLLANFRNQAKKACEGMDKLFQDKSGSATIRLDYETFKQICHKIRCPKPWDQIFDLLDVKCVGSITWEEAKFLQEDYKWTKAGAIVVRKDATPLGGTRNAGGPQRATGIGHIGIDMKPRKVFLPKSNSLPDINRKLRPNWNERHTIFDTRETMTDNTIHLMKYVKVEDEIRIARRVRKKLVDYPTEQWLHDNMPQDEDDYDEEEDDGWAMATN